MRRPIALVAGVTAGVALVAGGIAAARPGVARR